MAGRAEGVAAVVGGAKGGGKVGVWVSGGTVEDGEALSSKSSRWSARA